MGVPSAAIVYTGAAGEMPGSGKGAAYSEGISSTLDIVNNAMQTIRENEKVKREEAKQKNDAWNSMLEETPDVWNTDFESVRTKADEYNNYVKGLQQQGFDPNNLPSSEFKELKRLEAEVIRETNAAKANKEFWDKSSLDISKNEKGVWDQGYATEWFKTYSNPDLTPTQRAKIRQESSPYLKNVDLTELVGDIGDVMEEQKITQGGYNITSKSVDDFKKLLDVHFSDQSGMDEYDALMKSGKYNNKEDLIKQAAEIFKLMYKEDKVKTGGGGGGGKGPQEEKKEKITVVGKDKVDDPKFDPTLSANKLSLGGKLPEMSVTTEKINSADVADKVENFVPSDGFYIKPGGAVTVIGWADYKGKRVLVEIDYKINKGMFDSAGYPDMFDEFRRIKGETPTFNQQSKAKIQSIDPN